MNLSLCWLQQRKRKERKRKNNKALKKKRKGKYRKLYEKEMMCVCDSVTVGDSHFTRIEG
jgi:hypothetical protein